MRNVLSLILILLSAPALTANTSQLKDKISALSIGDRIEFRSVVLSEKRRINVYLPQAYQTNKDKNFPVIYMPDGGIHEDFLHIAGLIQIGALNWTMRPFILVGIENTDRKRDLTGPSDNPKDKAIGELTGGSNKFRQFIRHELMPLISKNYRINSETAIIGESLAGLFVVETLLKDPDLFDSYIAIDPSLWWDNQRLVQTSISDLAKNLTTPRKLHLAASSQQGIVEPTRELAKKLATLTTLKSSYQEYPEETHLSIYHPAALDSFRLIFPRNTN